MDTRHPDSPLARINLEEPLPGDADPRVYPLQQAYASVMAGVEIEESIKESMFPEYAAAYASGDNKRCMDVCIYFLLGSGWTWREFDVGSKILNL